MTKNRLAEGLSRRIGGALSTKEQEDAHRHIEKKWLDDVLTKRLPKPPQIGPHKKLLKRISGKKKLSEMIEFSDFLIEAAIKNPQHIDHFHSLLKDHTANDWHDHHNAIAQHPKNGGLHANDTISLARRVAGPFPKHDAKGMAFRRTKANALQHMHDWHAKQNAGNSIQQSAHKPVVAGAQQGQSKFPRQSSGFGQQQSSIHKPMLPATGQSNGQQSSIGGLAKRIGGIVKHIGNTIGNSLGNSKPKRFGGGKNVRPSFASQHKRGNNTWRRPKQPGRL